jgi:hypothetical protein
MKRVTVVLFLLAPAFGQAVRAPSWCEKVNRELDGPRSVYKRQSTSVTCADLNIHRPTTRSVGYPSSAEAPAFELPVRDADSRFVLYASNFITRALSKPASVICALNLAGCDSSGDPLPATASFDTASVVPCNYYGVMHVGAGCAYYWGGGDIGAQWQKAYAALPASGGEIITNRQFGGYNFSTPFSASTPGKLVMLDLGGNVINYTPTTATTAITLNYGTTTGPFIFNLGHGVRNGELTNHGCVLGLQCAASSAVGISLGTSAATGPSFDNLAIGGFSIGLETQGGLANMWGAVGTNIMLSSNAVGLRCNGLYESLQLFGFKAISNGTGILNAGGCDVYVHGGSFDANTLAVSNAAHTILDGVHIELSVPFPGDTRVQHMVESSATTVRILNSMLLDNNKTGTVDQWMSCANGSIDLSNDVFYSGGRHATQVINTAPSCTAQGSYENDSPDALLNFFGGTGFNDLHLANDRNATSQITSSKFTGGDIFMYSGNPDFPGPWGVTGVSAGSGGPSYGFYFRFGSAGPVWQGDNAGGHIYAESAPGGTVWADITSAGMKINGSIALGSSSVTCNASHAGTINYNAGGSGQKDTVQICVKDASDVYSWQTIY